MSFIEIKNLNKKYISGKKEIHALDNINLRLETGKYHALLGPSGCGKTTLLRTIAGLIEATSGDILFDGKNVTGLSAQERDIGFVFQQFALFPHLDVWNNTAYGPITKGWKENEIKNAVETNLKLVGLLNRSDAMPDTLSGGMKQRVGLARALATKSWLLLLDEPLSALDAKIGEFLRYELKRIVGKNHHTAIHVTHNQEEAMVIADNIILMKKGRIIQTGSPEELYNNPQSIFCANFIGKCNFINGERISEGVMSFKHHKIKFKGDVSSRRMTMGIRPERIHMARENTGERFKGVIESINFLGYLYEYVVDFEGDKIKTYKRIKEKQIKEVFRIGDEVYFWFNPEDTFAWPEPASIKEEISLE